jgi:LytR cell envelope-related transcriptional attenuator
VRSEVDAAAGAAAAGAAAAPKPDTPPVPAATPAAGAAGPAPRPQPAAPLRAPTPAATLPPRTPAGARPGAPGGRSRGRLAAIIGGALAAVAVVVVAAILLFGGGSGKNEPPKPNTVAQPGAAGATGGGNATPKTPVKLNRKQFPLAVLNGTTVTGLARSAADKLTRKGYNEPNVVTNDTTNQARDTTEIYFEASARAAALDVAKILGVRTTNVKPMDANARALADRATVAVFVGADKAQ